MLALPDVRLDQYRADLGEITKDMLTGGATSGSASTLIDTRYLIQRDSYWTNGWACLTKGTGAPALRMVSAYAQATSQITVSPNFSIAPDQYTTYELHRLWSPIDKNAAINHAIRLVYPRFKRVKMDTSITTASETYKHLLPGDCDRLIKVEMERVPSIATYPYYEIAGIEEIIEGNARYLQLPRQLPIGRTVRVHYESRDDTLQVDDDIAQVPREYVRFKAAAFLCDTVPISGQQDRKEFAALADRYEQRAERSLRGYVVRPQPGRVLSPADGPYDGINGGGYEVLAGFHSP